MIIIIIIIININPKYEGTKEWKEWWGRWNTTQNELWLFPRRRHFVMRVCVSVSSMPIHRNATTFVHMFKYNSNELNWIHTMCVCMRQNSHVRSKDYCRHQAADQLKPTKWWNKYLIQVKTKTESFCFTQHTHSCKFILMGQPNLFSDTANRSIKDDVSFVTFSKTWTKENFFCISLDIIRCKTVEFTCKRY